ncbi:DUF1801 domain-containing protein [Sabulilitoribacter multivorans]|uniref:DUF1801 domain-containing protein n=1 Tax=Flaviramulus multivorans TaxID=1304750 RepID=A0ABS9II33_9FLAO|nr:DUF1801 domain-containing protein [Flaviramulus multivorans]MCF7560432.1 DUF1801 domain-containing protein [Flaviramulus multivorans]
MKPAEDYILRQEEPYKTILLQLQSIIEAVVPNAQLFYKWKIPFYYCNGIPLCYLNQSKDYVDLAFWHGDALQEYREYFVVTNRKTVTSLRFKTVDDIIDEVIIYVIEQQLLINTNPFKLILKPKSKT